MYLVWLKGRIIRLWLCSEGGQGDTPPWADGPWGTLLPGRRALPSFGMPDCPGCPRSGQWERGEAPAVDLGREEAGKQQPRGSRGRDTPVGG